MKLSALFFNAVVIADLDILEDILGGFPSSQVSAELRFCFRISASDAKGGRSFETALNDVRSLNVRERTQRVEALAVRNARSRWRCRRRFRYFDI